MIVFCIKFRLSNCPNVWSCASERKSKRNGLSSPDNQGSIRVEQKSPILSEEIGRIQRLVFLLTKFIEGWDQLVWTKKWQSFSYRNLRRSGDVRQRTAAELYWFEWSGNHLRIEICAGPVLSGIELRLSNTGLNEVAIIFASKSVHFRRCPPRN